MATDFYIKRKNHRLMDGKDFKIVRVYNYYREGGLNIDGKYIGKTFILTPSRVTDDIVLSGDERLKPQDGDVMVLREAIWNKDLKVRELHKYTGKVDRDFFKTYKKVYDIEIVVNDSVEVPVWDKDSSSEVLRSFPGGSTATLNSFPQGRLINLLETLDLDSGVKLVDGKDKLGNPAKVKPFDWEDEVKGGLEGKFVQMRVKGTGLETKYIFKEVAPFLVEEKPNNSTVEELTLEDVPF